MKKQIKARLDAAKKAWDKAVADKLEEKKIAKAKAIHDQLQSAFEALKDIADEDDADPAPAEKKDKKKADENPTEVTLDEIGELIAKSVKSTIEAQLEPALKGQLTEEGIKKIVADALAANKSDSTEMSAADMDILVKGVVTEAMTKIKRPSKMQHQEDDERGQIEMPVSWRKGNLAVHAKQLLNRLMGKPQDEGITEPQLKKAVEAGEKTIDSYREHARMGKALTQSTSGDLYPLDLSSELQRRLYLSSNLAAMMAAREIEMPSQPYDLPLSTTRPTFYLNNTQRSAQTESTPGTARPRLDAQRLIAQVNYSYEADEDSIIPVLQMIQTLLADAAAAAYESAIINGDAVGAHQDSDTDAITGAAEKAFNGFRVLALAQSATISTSVTGGFKGDNNAGVGAGLLNMIAMKKLMKKYGINIKDLGWIVGPSAENDIMSLNQVVSLEKFGPKATIMSGEIATILGIPIIVSEQQREDLTVNAVFLTTAGAYSAPLLVNFSQFLTGRRREFTIETFRNVQTQDNNIVASFRKAFTPLETPGTTVPSVIIAKGYPN